VKLSSRNWNIVLVQDSFTLGITLRVTGIKPSFWDEGSRRARFRARLVNANLVGFEKPGHCVRELLFA
jgi:hypothetical protein